MSGANEELWQGYNEQGEPTVAITKDEAREGALHAASHVWIWRKKDGEIDILLQRRAKDKATWANHLDISAAGHVDSGETPLIAAIRETKEEIGITIESAKLTLVNAYRAYLIADLSGKRIIENEFQFIYLLNFTDAADEIVLLDGEVEETKWVSLTDFERVIEGESSDVIVPHGKAYFDVLLEALADHVAS